MSVVDSLKKKYASAVGAWCGRHRIATIAVGGIAFLLFWSWLVNGWWLLSEGPRQALTAYGALDPKEKVEAFGKLATALGLLVAAPFAFLGVGLAVWRTWNQHRDSELAARKLEIESRAKQADSELAERKHDAEAFAKAVEQLGHAEISIRMGAVLALQTLAEASPRRLLGQTLEILCAYVREKRPRTKKADEREANALTTDIKLIIEVISRLNRRNTNGKIPVDLRNTDLRKADFRDSHLERVDFSDSNLIGADLTGANLQGASLWDANPQEAELMDANLQNARLWNANLRGANLGRANLQGAYLAEANLQGAGLIGAKLQDAYLAGANLRGANLGKANLQDAYLARANLQDADLTGAKLEGAGLTGTILEKREEAGG